MINTEKEAFLYFADVLMENRGNIVFSKCWIEMERQEKMSGFSIVYIDESGEERYVSIKNIEKRSDLYSAILDLYTITQTQPPIHKDWNRAVFTLYPDGKVNMEYIWDAEWQAEIDKYNAKIRAAQKARETRLAKKTFFERGYRMKLIGSSFSRFVMINGTEYRLFYSSDVVVNCIDDPKKIFNLGKDSEIKDFINKVVEDPFVDGIHTDPDILHYDLPYSKFEEILKYEIRSANLNNCYPTHYVWPFHKVRKSEVESFYQCSLSIVIGGVEISKFDDAEVGYYGYPDKYPGYIDVSASERENEIVSALPQEELKKISVGNPHEGFTYPTLIPNKFIEKIIFRRKHLNIDLVEEGEDSQEFTGKEDVFEVDPNHPDQKVLDMMEKYKVIEMKKKYRK